MLSKILPKAKTIAFILSFGLIAGIGLAYILLSDFLLSNAATWLLIASIFSIGSAVCVILSSSYKEKPKTMYILLAIALVCAILFVATIYFFAEMPLYNDKDGVMGTANYIRQFNKLQKSNAEDPVYVEGVDMPNYLTVVQETVTENNTAVTKYVCKESIFWIRIQYTGNTPVETLRENKTYNTERNFNAVVVWCKVFGYMAVAVQAAYIALCAVVKEK